MKKIYSLLVCFVFVSLHSQYLIVGKDSISAEKFIKANQYGLENAGIEQTVKNYIDFRLMQQFALDKKADTLSYFNKRIYEKEQRLRDDFFYPLEIKQAALNQFITANQTEKKIQVFYLEKKGNTPAVDYQKVYQEVKSGKLSMEDAVVKYTQQKPEAFYIKPGSLSYDLYRELQSLPVGGYTSLIHTDDSVVFAKLTDQRPSLGYLVFGTISYANNAEAPKMKTQILEALKSGKKFEEVAKLYGSTDSEKANAGIVMGSPVLPDAVYEALRNRKQGEYTEPVPVGDKYYVFNVYSLIPYEKDERYEDLMMREMMNSQFAEVPYRQLVNSLVASEDYKETAELGLIKKSYASFLAFKNSNAVLYQYQNKKFKFGDLKKALAENLQFAKDLPKEQWTALVNSQRDRDVFELYNSAFLKRSDIRLQLETERQNLLADFLFSYWIEQELKNKPELLDRYFSEHRTKYAWEPRAAARVAIISEPSVRKEVSRDIADPKRWEGLNKKFYGKTNSKDQLMVHFEKGDMSQNAEVFLKYGVPFKVGVHEVEIQNRLLVIAIDELLPAKPMTREEAEEQLRDDVVEELLAQTIEMQKNKTKIVVEEAFLAALSRNFKK